MFKLWINYFQHYNNNLYIIDIPLEQNKLSLTEINNFIAKSFKIGLNLLKKKNSLALINGPISKTAFLKGKYNGVTEYLAFETGSLNEVMLIFNKKLSVSPITTHIPISQVAQKIKKKHYINVQGDEPLINPDDIRKIISKSLADPEIIFNGMCDITAKEDFISYNVPKVVCSGNNDLLYMSRAPIPSNKSGDFIKAKRQVCIYSFPRDFLLRFAQCENKTLNESIEDIEIIRFLELGFKVRMIEVSKNPVAVDTEEDLVRAKRIIEENIKQKTYK